MYFVEFVNNSPEKILHELFQEKATNLISYLNANGGEFYSDFDDDTYLSKFHESKICIKATHVTTSATQCSDIKKLGLLNLQQAATQNCELKSFLKLHGIRINIRERKVIINEDMIELSAESNSCEQEWIYHKLYRDYFINGFIDAEDPLDYSVILHYPEFIDKLQERINSDLGRNLDLRDSWKDRTNPYLVEFYFPIEKLHSEIFLGFHKDLDFTVNQLASERMKWFIRLLFDALEHRERHLDKMIYLKSSYQVPPGNIMSVQAVL